MSGPSGTCYSGGCWGSPAHGEHNRTKPRAKCLEMVPTGPAVTWVPFLGPRLPGQWPSAPCSLQGPGGNSLIHLLPFNGGRLYLPHIGLLHCLPPRELRRLVYACVYVICVWGGVCSSALSERPSGEHLSVPFVLLCWQRRGQ